MHSGLVTVSEMKSEFIDNNTVFFGEFNFTNLDVCLLLFFFNLLIILYSEILT